MISPWHQMGFWNPPRRFDRKKAKKPNRYGKMFLGSTRTNDITSEGTMVIHTSNETNLPAFFGITLQSQRSTHPGYWRRMQRLEVLPAKRSRDLCHAGIPGTPLNFVTSQAGSPRRCSDHPRDALLAVGHLFQKPIIPTLTSRYSINFHGLPLLLCTSNISKKTLWHLPYETKNGWKGKPTAVNSNEETNEPLRLWFPGSGVTVAASSANTSSVWLKETASEKNTTEKRTAGPQKIWFLNRNPPIFPGSIFSCQPGKTWGVFSDMIGRHHLLASWISLPLKYYPTRWSTQIII